MERNELRDLLAAAPADDQARAGVPGESFRALEAVWTEPASLPFDGESTDDEIVAALRGKTIRYRTSYSRRIESAVVDGGRRICIGHPPSGRSYLDFIDLDIGYISVYLDMIVSVG